MQTLEELIMWNKNEEYNFNWQEELASDEEYSRWTEEYEEYVLKHPDEEIIWYDEE